jgi:tRNA (guanine-N7-)-methyltransferase
VRRTDRLSVGQQRAWDNYSQAYLLDFPRGLAATSVDPNWTLNPADVYGRTAPLTIEVGSGRGENIVAAAASHPDRDFLALEVYIPGLARTMLRAQHAVAARDEHATGAEASPWAAAEPGHPTLTNLRVAEVDAVELLDTAIEPGTLDQLWVFFPDPWPKKRHHKRRIVNPRFADAAAKALRPGGTWRLATDWAQYAAWMVDAIEGSVEDSEEPDWTPHPAFRNVHGPRAHAPRFDGRVLTAFESRGIDAGRDIADLEYVRL